MTWPYPGDAPLTRARRAAHAYRALLADVDPHACAEMDARMLLWGEEWMVPRVVSNDPDEWVGVLDAAALAYVKPAQLRTWRRRGRIKGLRVGTEWRYRVGDVMALADKPRRRGEEGKEA